MLDTAPRNEYGRDMSASKRPDEPLSIQLRRLIEESGMSRYRLAKLSGVDEGLLGKFVRGERAGLRLDTIDAIGRALRLRLVAEAKPEKKGR